MSLLLGKKKSKKTVVFLCTGNTCRGPMAQGYMKHVLAEKNMKHVEVKTAGVMTIPGLIPTPEATQVMEGAGIDITGHRSSPLTKELIRKADIILGMTPFHVQFALRMSDEAKGKTYLLKEFAESDVKNYQITDPMGMTLEVYKRVYREMKLAIDKMVDKDFFKVQEEESRFSRFSTLSAPPAASAAKKSAAPAPPKSGSVTTPRTGTPPAPKTAAKVAAPAAATAARPKVATPAAPPAKAKATAAAVPATKKPAKK